jgi:predicted ATP-dependent endonuclease of OLD family
VRFKEYQVMDFSSDGPFILIGENGSGKSSVLEGIRRCLKLELSTSMSSIFDIKTMSYFICTAETAGLNENVIFGIVAMPKNDEFNNEETNVSQTVKKSKVEDKIRNESLNQSSLFRFYKFALSNDNQIFIDLIASSEVSEGEAELIVSNSYTCRHGAFIKAVLDPKPKEHVIETCINSIFRNLHTDQTPYSAKLGQLLCDLTEQFVLTFPLRSIGPLQWSESTRITSAWRTENYNEAEKRCEIIKYFLKDNGKTFDKDKEKEYFQHLTQKENYDFTLEDDKISLPKGKFALLKTPEGILEAKAFSILISSKQYKTILLEEPDRGMHPQILDRMIEIIHQEKGRKRVILTTHQKAFITPWTVSDTFIFKHTKANEETRIVSGTDLFADKRDGSMKKKALLTSHNIPDILFASKVLFYEGLSEHLFLGELRSQILAGTYSVTSGVFEDDKVEANKRLKKSLMEYTLVCMNGRDNQTFYYKISKKLGLDFLILLDKDILYKQIPKEERKNRIKMETRDELATKRAEYLKEKNIFFWIDGAIEDMVLAMCKKYQGLKDKLAAQKMEFPPEVKDDNSNGPKLFLHDKGIKKVHITESVKLLLGYCRPDDDLAELIKKFI